jgi:hypothetical protein
MLFSRLRLEKMALQASAAAYIKIRLAGTVNRLNVDVHFLVNPLYETSFI